MTERPRPLVLLHGVGQSPIAWQDFVSAYGAGRPMTAPWMRGLRPTDPVGFDLDAAASGIADELELQGVRRADLVGVSVGASVALRLAVQRPGLVGRLVVGSVLERPTRSALRLQKLALRLVPESKLVDAGVSRPRMLAVLDALGDFDGADAFARVAAPTLVVAGARDRGAVASGRRLAGVVPGARFEAVEGAGSLLDAAGARSFAETVHAFLDASA